MYHTGSPVPCACWAGWRPRACGPLHLGGQRERASRPLQTQGRLWQRHPSRAAGVLLSCFCFCGPRGLWCRGPASPAHSKTWSLLLMRLALPSHLGTWEPSSSSTRAVQAPLGPHGGVGISDCVCVERSLRILPPSASPWLCLCLGFSGLRGNDRAGLGWAGGTAQGPWAPGLSSESIVQVWGWPRAGDKPLGTRAPGSRVRAGTWGEGCGCCSLYNNKPASARGLWRGCSVCLWAQPGGLAEGGRDAAGPVFFLQFP